MELPVKGTYISEVQTHIHPKFQTPSAPHFRLHYHVKYPKKLSQKYLSHSPKSSLSSQLLPASINIVSLNNLKMFMIEVLSSFMGSLQTVVESLYLFPDYLSLLSGVVLGYPVCTACSHAGKLTLQFLWIIVHTILQS